MSECSLIDLPHEILYFIFNSHSGRGVWSPYVFTRQFGHLWHTVPAPGDCEDGEFGGLKICRETEVLGETLQ
jgi:hypothetical protein